MKNLKILSMLLISIVFLNSCNKELENKLQKDIDSKKETSSSHGSSNARLGTGTSGFDSMLYYTTLANPCRDIIMYNANNVGNISAMISTGGGGFPPPPTTCGGITVTGTFVKTPPTGWCGTDVPPTYVPGMKDFWNNKIWFTAQYGTDVRQKYYIYYPANKNPNSPIAVLIHGGGWTTGPNLANANANGWISTYTTSGTEANNNIVKNLLAQGYVVMVPLYRLVQYGDNNTEIMANTITIQDQINDIDAAITHMKTNFPSCLNLNVNSVQLLGESAGAHLALMFAYTKANTSYIKSVVSVAGPTNMNQLANWVQNPPFPFVCGEDYMLDNPNTTTYTHFTLYGIYDPNAIGANLTTSASVNPLTSLSCTVDTIYKYAIYPYTNLFFWNGLRLTLNTTVQNTAKRITNSFRLAESCIKQIITNPVTTEFNNVSPSVALNASRIIPTFIIHGTDDWVVPYTKATLNMEARLGTTGGLIGTYNSTSKNIFGNSNNPTTFPLLPSTIPASSDYSTNTNRHIIKTYTGSNHNVSNNALTQPDILTWFNGHK